MNEIYANFQRPLKRFANKDRKIFRTQPFSLTQILYCFVLFVDKIFCPHKFYNYLSMSHLENLKGG
jgi:hypothetical protein